MTGQITRRDDCRLCAGKDLHLGLHLTPAPIVDAYVPAERLGEMQETYPLDVYVCSACGHSQLLDVVDPQVLYRDYIYVTASSPGLTEHFHKYADAVMRRVNPSEGALVVDIGSNDGTLLRFFQGQGAHVLGIDPAVDIARQATQSGVETVPEFFTAVLSRQIKKERGAATIVTVNNLYANVDDLADFTEGIRHLLSLDGVLVFESFYLVDLIQNMVFDFIYHEHLSCFSVKPLNGFFGRHGMELIDVERVATKGGSLRYTVQLAGGPRCVSQSVSSMLSLEENLGIGTPRPLKAFAAKIDQRKSDLVTLLRGLQAKGKTMAGYGASASTTPLLYHFGIGDVLSFIVDDNPAKQNLYSPGYHIPVLPSHAIYERKPDFVLILAWRFSEPIIDKHQAYLDQGGHFIVPLPELQIT
jgi:SAM-dependent methyltransferase